MADLDTGSRPGPGSGSENGPGPGLDLSEGGRSALTMVVLAVVFLAAVGWAWSRVTEPFPAREKAGPCTDTLIAAGEDLAPPQVMVTVLNGGGPNGMAGKTLQQLVGFGFAEGRTGNAPTGTAPQTAQIWATSADEPAALLLASYLGKGVEVVDQPSGYPGVTIVVGKKFKGVVKGHPTVTAAANSYVCVPPLSTDAE